MDAGIKSEVLGHTVLTPKVHVFKTLYKRPFIQGLIFFRLLLYIIILCPFVDTSIDSYPTELLGGDGSLSVLSPGEKPNCKTPVRPFALLYVTPRGVKPLSGPARLPTDEKGQEHSSELF